METTKNRRADAQVEEVERQVIAQVEESVEETDIFAQLMGDADSDKEVGRDAIIKKLLASGNAKRVNNLHVRNVTETTKESHTLITFTVAECVIGDIREGEDAFGQPLLKLGKTHNVQSSNFAVAGVMKDSPKLAIFAADFVDGYVKGVELFAGASIDVILEFVPANTEYVNPFASNSEPVMWDRDKMIHHIVRLELGEVGKDKYLARISR